MNYINSMHSQVLRVMDPTSLSTKAAHVLTNDLVLSLDFLHISKKIIGGGKDLMRAALKHECQNKYTVKSRNRKYCGYTKEILCTSFVYDSSMSFFVGLHQACMCVTAVSIS